MAKNKQQNRSRPEPNLPGGEEGREDTVNEDGGTVVADSVEIESEVTEKQDQPSSKDADKNKVDRALMHLEFLTQELQGLSADRSSLAGPMRKMAAKMKEQLETDMSQWAPIKTTRTLLEQLREHISGNGGISG